MWRGVGDCGGPQGGEEKMVSSMQRTRSLVAWRGEVVTMHECPRCAPRSQAADSHAQGSVSEVQVDVHLVGSGMRAHQSDLRHLENPQGGSLTT
ncbi:unnamed protein product [Citrullus colocynthis]|uniref:Uncharacterized protein n=1 Tax=Citrullus colocynthis TaxID=252529 RepID=A0ABP0XZV1_9ROSI